MTNYGSDPVVFRGESFVTATLDGKSPQLGQEMQIGGRTYVWAHNAGNNDVSPGMGMVLMSDASNYSLSSTSVTSADICVGVVRNATFLTANYGWLVRRGVTNIEMGATSGTVAAHGPVEIAADGLFVPVSNTTANLVAAVGKALTDIVSSASGEAYISCM